MSSVLDFRDIHQHPPTAAGEPLPRDPSWDAHKVYFNERPKDEEEKKKGDEFDDLFDQSNSSTNEEDKEAFTANFDSLEELNNTEKEKTSTVNSNMQNNKSEDGETLDPLGWPMDAFRSLGGQLLSSIESRNDSNSNSNNGYEEEEDDEEDADDLNLLRKSDDPGGDDATNTVVNLISSLGIVDDQTAHSVVEGVQNMFLFNPTSTATNPESNPTTEDNQGSQPLEKNERIKMYETTAVDDESSVEEDDGQEDDEEWEKDREVGYVAAVSTEEEEDLGIFGTVETGATSNVDSSFVMAEPVHVPTFVIPPLDTSSSAKKKKKSGTGGAVPLIRPPPAEKLQKWEEAKARPLLHLEKSAAAKEGSS